MAEPASPADVVRLEYRTPSGGQSTVIAEGGGWNTDGTGLSWRPLHSSDGTTLMEQWSVPPAEGRVDPVALDMLQNEIRAALRIARRYGSSSPASLPHLVGYDLDADAPFLLCRPTFGRPVTDLAGRLLLNQRHGFQTALFRALTLLAEAGVVHGGLRPCVVRWDGREVCLTEFGLAAAAGEPYRQEVSSPWMPPTVTRNVAADPGDDVWAAGLIVSHLVTGLPVEKLHGASATAEASSLASLLDGVFVGEPARRPSAAQILRRLGDPVRVQPDLGPDAALEAGRAAFDTERAKKLRPTPPGQPAPAEPPPRPPAHLRPTLLMVAGVVFIAGLLLIGWQVFT